MGPRFPHDINNCSNMKKRVLFLSLLSTDSSMARKTVDVKVFSGREFRGWSVRSATRVRYDAFTRRIDRRAETGYDVPDSIFCRSHGNNK